MTKIWNTAEITEKVYNELNSKIKNLKSKPRLSIVLCGEKQDSLVYVNSKKNLGEKLGIEVSVYRLSEKVTQKNLNELIERLNHNSEGLIVQLPLPNQIDANEAIKKINPRIDVDGLTPLNLGLLISGKEEIIPATPKGIMRILEHHKINLNGKNIVIINHSNLLGKPLGALLLKKGATVTICHKYTKDLSLFTKNADVLITGVGKPNLITRDMIKEDAIVIDAGISKKNGKIFGDVDFESVKDKASAITPVPGGVGPMTVHMLFENLLEMAN